MYTNKQHNEDRDKPVVLLPGDLYYYYDRSLDLIEPYIVISNSMDNGWQKETCVLAISLSSGRLYNWFATWVNKKYNKLISRPK